MLHFQKTKHAFHPFLKYRINRAEEFGEEFDQFIFKVNSAARSEVPEAWVYWADSAKIFAMLPRVLNQEALQKEKIRPEHIMMMNSQLEIPQTYLHQKFLADTLPVADVQVDYLLSYEKKGPTEYEPVLSFFFRLGAPSSVPKGK